MYGQKMFNELPCEVKWLDWKSYLAVLKSCLDSLCLSVRGLMMILGGLVFV